MAKILLVISKFHPEYTGASHRLSLMYLRLLKQHVGLTIDVVCNSTSYMESADYIHDGWKVQRRVFPWKCVWLPTRLRNVLKVYYEFFHSLLCFIHHKPDLVHIVGYSGGTMAALLYFKWQKIPRMIELITKEATPVQFLPGLRYRHALALDIQSVIVAISQKLADNCNELGIIGNVWSRPNPVDERVFCIDEEAKWSLRQKYSPFKKSDIVIGMVAKFMPQKNQNFLLHVLQKLPKNFKLLLAGPKVKSGIFEKRDDDYFLHIQDNIKNLALQNRVHIYPRFVDAHAYMKACDIYVMPQYNEGLGTPMLEAMACGLPVVANKNEAAFSQWIENGQNGFLCSLNTEEWSAAIFNASKMPFEQRQKFSKDVLSVANATLIDKQYDMIIEQLLKSMPQDKLDISVILKK